MLAAVRILEDAPSGRRRVAPLAPDDRRAALIEATLPLLSEHGMAVSTRQIADAAGVAEGTIFRVFPDKTALIVATALRGTDPAPGVAALARIDRAADLRTRLTEATKILTYGLAKVGRLHLVLRELMGDPQTAAAVSGHMNANRAAMTTALADLMAPDAASLRVNPVAAARLILVMTFTVNGHLFADEEHITATDLVSVLLDGLLAPPSEPAAGNPAARPATVRESPC